MFCDCTLNLSKSPVCTDKYWPNLAKGVDAILHNLELLQSLRQWNLPSFAHLRPSAVGRRTRANSSQAACMRAPTAGSTPSSPHIPIEAARNFSLASTTFRILAHSSPTARVEGE